MSGYTEQLGRKIAGATDLGGVVRAMKALAASSIAQYEECRYIARRLSEDGQPWTHRLSA
jgi:hypothetical protein